MSAAIKPAENETTPVSNDKPYQIRVASTSTANNPASAFRFAKSRKTRRATFDNSLEDNPPVRVLRHERAMGRSVCPR